MNTCLFIYNPISGKGKIIKNINYIYKKLSEKFDTVLMYPTKYSGEVTDKILQDAENYTTIIISGGDGTFNEMVNAVARLENKPNIGYIPTGTVNDIARSVGISSSIRKAVKIICNGRVELLDCMKIQEKYAMYVVATGGFTHTAYATPQKIKKRFGKFAYALEAFKTNINFRTFCIEVERNLTNQNDKTDIQEETQKDSIEYTNKIVKDITHSIFVIIMNGKYVAGRPINKKSSMLDGEVEVAIIKQVEKPNFWRKIIAFFHFVHFFIWGYYIPHKRIQKFKGKEFTIKTLDEVVWSYDGEKGESGTIHILVETRSIPLIVPEKRKKL